MIPSTTPNKNEPLCDSLHLSQHKSKALAASPAVEMVIGTYLSLFEPYEFVISHQFIMNIGVFEQSRNAALNDRN